MKPKRVSCRPCVSQLARLLVVLLIGGSLLVDPFSNGRRADAATSCGPSFGAKAPVLFVHGLSDDAGVWATGSRPMMRTVRDETGAYVSAFDYSSVNEKWVTDAKIGPALSERIRCLARLSAEGGGPGKVIIVAHSMGGLATRIASSAASESIALVITIGTPHMGSDINSFLVDRVGTGSSGALETLWFNFLSGSCDLGSFTSSNNGGPGWEGFCRLLGTAGSDAAKAMRVGSSELSDLPVFPSGIPILAIVGDMEARTTIFKQTLSLGRLGDGVVTTDSANRFGTPDLPPGGSSTQSCVWDIRELLSLPGCAHTSLPGDRWVGEAVVKAISGVKSPLTLSPEGLLPELAFGDSAAEVETVLSSRYGPASSDTGWISLVRVRGPYANADSPYGDEARVPSITWDRPSYRELCWAQLCVVLGGESSEDASFTGWSVAAWRTASFEAVARGRIEQSPDLTTTEGVGVGAAVTLLQSSYPNVEFTQGEGGALGFDLGWSSFFDGVQSGNGRVQGLWNTGLGRPEIRPNAQVQSLIVGDGPSATCC